MGQVQSSEYYGRMIDEPAHLRWFNNLHEVTLRYQNVLQLQTGATGKDEADNRMWFFVHAKS
jgi:hypothetical protein